MVWVPTMGRGGALARLLAAAICASSASGLPRARSAAAAAGAPAGADDAGGVVLVRDGAPAATLVLPWRDESNNTRVAAAELVDHVRRLTGATLPTAVDSALPQEAALPNTSKIWLGNVSHTQRHLQGLVAPLPPEGYATIAHGGDLFVFGDDLCNQTYPNDPFGPCRMGTVFAAAALLRDQLGVRWLWPGESGVHTPPRVPTLSVPSDLNVTSAPKLLNRATGNPWKPTGWCKEYYEQHAWLTGYTDEICEAHNADLRQWSLRMGYGAHDMPKAGEGAGTRLWQQGSLDNMTGWKQKHPEYFALLPTGQRGPVVDHTTHGPEHCPGSHCGQYVHMCVSNPALHQRIVNDSLPDIVSGTTTGISAVDDDGGSGFCTCPKCRALDSPVLPADWDGTCKDPKLPLDAGRLSDRYAYYAKAIYEELLRRLPGRDDLWVTTCARTAPALLQALLTRLVAAACFCWQMPTSATTSRPARSSFQNER